MSPSRTLTIVNTDELDLAATSDVYWQHTLDDDASLNDPDVDDNQLAKYLAVVVDSTGKPVEMRSNNDQFSCGHSKLEKCSESVSFGHSTRNDLSNWGGLFKQESLKSERALMHRLGQCWMNSEERLSLSALKKFFITNSSQLMPNKIAKFFKKNYCDSNRNFVKFISKIL